MSAVDRSDALLSSDDFSLDFDGEQKPPSRIQTARRSIRFYAILTTVLTTIVLSLFLYSSLWQNRISYFSSKEKESLSPLVGVAQDESGSSKKWALVMSSVTDQDVSWMKDLPSRWEPIRYMMDDPLAEYSVPVNYGREAMAYLTYIIDHYDDLPDVMAFIHGHNNAWHQPEPMVWKLEAINETALVQDKYIGFKCRRPLSCVAGTYVDPHHLAPEQQNAAFRMLKSFWAFARLDNSTSTSSIHAGSAPSRLAGPSSAQFVVTREAVLGRSLEWWKRFRSPLLGKVELDTRGMDTYMWGLVYERTWHAAFGKPAFYCPPELYCYEQQWSNGVLCNGYPENPLNHHWDTAQDDVECFRNKNSSIKGWQFLTWTTANYSTDERPLPLFSGQPMSDIEWP